MTKISARQYVMRRMYAPVDASSIGAFRVMFGLVMLAYALHTLRAGYLYDSYVRPHLQFTYLGFGWITPLPYAGLVALTVALMGFAACITLGIFQRLAAAAFCIGWTYFFLLDKAYYINHFYLVSLLTLLLAVLPGSAAYAPRWAGYTATQVPAWHLWTLRAQFGILYFYAGLAKIQSDWIAGEPMRAFLAPYFNSPIGETSRLHNWAAYAFSWGGLGFDLLIVPGLLWPRTRTLTLLLALGFHVFNHAVFNIGFFPWLAMAGTLLYLPPDWPRQLLGRLNIAAGDRSAPPPRLPDTPRFLLPALACFFAVQAVLPFQRFLYPGNSHWTEEGQKFSWQLMMKNKVGTAEFTIENLDTGERERIIEKRYLNDLQLLMMAGDPDMLVQFAHFLAAEAHAQGIQRVAVYADTSVSLNSRPKQRIAPSDLNLASVNRSLGHYPWIVPLEDHNRQNSE